LIPMGATSPIARRCFHRDELGGEPAKHSSLCSCQLLPPSGQARMEGGGFEPSTLFISSTVRSWVAPFVRHKTF
jgi:hypothetical protein